MVGSIGTTGGSNAASIAQMMQERILQAVDSNDDGTVTENEFVSNRPNNVTEEQAQQMWSKLDTSGSASLTASQFITALENLGPPSGGTGDTQDALSASSGTSSTSATSASDNLVQALLAAIEKYTAAMNQTSSDASTTNQTRPSLSDLFSKIDSNGDGSLTESEFVSNRPKGMSEEQAQQMWNKLDPSGSASLTKSEFVSAMESLQPPQGGPAGQAELASASATDSSTGTTDSGTSTSATNELLQSLLAAIQNYASAVNPSDSSTTGVTTGTSSVSAVA